MVNAHSLADIFFENFKEKMKKAIDKKPNSYKMMFIEAMVDRMKDHDLEELLDG